MKALSIKTLACCLLIAAIIFGIRATGPAQDNDPTKKETDAPTTEESAPSTLLSAEELERLDSRILLSKGKDAEAYLARARGSDLLKNRFRIIDDLDNAERLGSKDPELHALRAEARGRIGDYAGELRDFQAGVLRGNDLGDRVGSYSLALYLTGNSQLALTELTHAIKKEPEDPYNYNIRGLLQRSLGKRALAMKDHDESIKLEPEDPWGYVERGCTNYAFGDYAAAKKDFERAIQLGNTDPYLYHYYAYFLATCEDPNFRDAKRALQLTGVALEIIPADGYALHAKACAIALEGEYDVAVGLGLRAREDREFAADPFLGGGVEGKAYLAAWKQGKPLFRTPDKEK